MVDDRRSEEKVDHYGWIAWNIAYQKMLTEPKMISLGFYMESVNGTETRKNYLRSLERFRRWGIDQGYGWYGYDDIVEQYEHDSKPIEKQVIGYIIYIKNNGVSPNSVKSYMSPIKGFLEANDIEIKWRRVEKFFPKKVRRSGVRAYATEEIQKMLDVAESLRVMALILFLAASGVRVGGVPGLRMKHLKMVDHGIRMVLVYEGEMEQYKTCITPEASIALERYHNDRKAKGEVFTDETLVFTSSVKGAKPVTTRALQMVIDRVAQKAGLRTARKVGKGEGAKQSLRFQTQLCHGFRKRFNTILKLNNDVNSNVVEKLMGHKKSEEIDSVLDDSYFTVGQDPRLDGILVENYHKGVEDLTISDVERLRIQNKELKREDEKKETELRERVQKLEDDKRDDLRRKAKQKEIDKDIEDELHDIYFQPDD